MTPLCKAINTGHSEIKKLLLLNFAVADLKNQEIFEKSNISGVNSEFKIDKQPLIKIFGYEPKININIAAPDWVCENGHIVERKGTFYEIIGKDNKYTFCPSQFLKKRNDLRINGDGLFEGPWDTIGQQIFRLYFSKFSDDSIVYINNQQCRLFSEGDLLHIKSDSELK